jgi:hypothetical protein
VRRHVVGIAAAGGVVGADLRPRCEPFYDIIDALSGHAVALPAREETVVDVGAVEIRPERSDGPKGAGTIELEGDGVGCAAGRRVLLDPAREPKLTFVEIDHFSVDGCEFAASEPGIVQQGYDSVVAIAVPTDVRGVAHGFDLAGLQEVNVRFVI